MSGRVETDAVALTAGARILGEGLGSRACQKLLNWKPAEIEWEISLWASVDVSSNPAPFRKWSVTWQYSSQHWPAPPRLPIPPQEPRGSWFCPWKQRAGWEAVAARDLQGDTKRLWIIYVEKGNTVNNGQLTRVNYEVSGFELWCGPSGIHKICDSVNTVVTTGKIYLTWKIRKIRK